MFTMNCESDDEQDDHLSIAQVEAKLLSEFVVQDKKEQKEEKQGSDPCIPKDKEGIEREENEEKSSALNGEADNEMEGEEKLDQTERWEDYPLKDIEEPHGHDVLFGRGGGTNHHKGNKQYRKMVEDYKVKYIELKTKHEKTEIATEIVTACRDRNPPGRFLQQDKETGKWYDVGDTKARMKTSQALREKAPLIRQQLEYTRITSKQDESGEFEELDQVQLTPLSEEANSLNDLLGLAFDREESIGCNSPIYSAFLGNDISDSNLCEASSSYLDSLETSDDSPRETILRHDLLESDMYSKIEAFKKESDWEGSSLKRKKDTGLAVCSIKRKSKNKSSWMEDVLERMEPAIQKTTRSSIMEEKIRELSVELEKNARIL